jgi:hypothetical protein
VRTRGLSRLLPDALFELPLLLMRLERVDVARLSSDQAGLAVEASGMQGLVVLGEDAVSIAVEDEDGGRGEEAQRGLRARGQSRVQYRLLPDGSPWRARITTG